MNLEKVVFGFFIVLAATLNFGFVYGDIDNPAHHDRWEFAAGGIALGELLRDSSDRGSRIAAFPLYLARGTNPIVLPPEDTVLQPGDQVLFAGTPDARRAQWPTLRNINVRDYILTGHEPGGWLWEKMQEKMQEKLARR